MRADEYFRAGKLKEAISALNEQIREEPLEKHLRTFLFELLCFAGEYDRAEKQLEVLAQGGGTPDLGVLLYRAALHAERTRQEFFANKEYLAQPENPVQPTGTLNTNPFRSISDADPRIGSRLEVFLGASYLWVPFRHITSLTIETPKRLRDLIWTPAVVHTSGSFEGRDLGEVLIPVLSPNTWQHENDEVRLGRVTVWEPQADGSEFPVGQKMLLVDEIEVPILELRNLELEVAAAA